MRPNSDVALNVPDVTSNVNGPAIPASQLLYVSLQALAAGSTPKGTVQLQASNDLPAAVSWTNVTNAMLAVNGANSYIGAPIQVCYQWIRLVWVKDGSAPGTGTCKGTINTQGF